MMSINKFINFIIAAATITILPAKVSAQVSEASIVINDKVRFQHVTGFGGFSPSPTWSYWLGTAEMNKLFGKGENQLGLNILRLYMGNSKTSWSSGVANARIAKKYGAFVFASPWSPPASWKTNNSDSNGGELLESRYSDWATFLNDYYLYMLQQGVKIDAVSVQNEPDWKTSYQSCIWTGEKMAKFLREQGSKIQCKIIAPEAVHFTKSMHEPILNDAEACEQLDILGGHFYGWDGSSYPLAAKKGKEVWMTEYLINERQQNQGLDINWKDDGFLFAQSINSAMLANMSAWVHYSLKRYYGCLGDGSYGTVDNQITKRGYILSHYAKYVSGTTRIRHSITDATSQLSVSAYSSQTGDSIIIMVINPADETYNTSITLPFNTSECRKIITTEQKSMVKSNLSFEDIYQPEVEIEPYSVTTYIFKKSSEREATDDDGEKTEAIFSDDFELYGSSCVPEGWRVKFEEGTRYAGEYSLGPRIMSFSNEGKMSHAFYFRTNTSGLGYISYGQETDYRLELTPGSYKLKFSTVGWKTQPTVTASVLKVGGKALQKLSVVPEYIVSENGSNSRITDTTDGEMTFSVNEQGNYILRWDIPSATGGMNEVLVGNIRLYKVDETGIESVLMDTDNKGIIYDLMGRPVCNPNHPGIYIRNGKKFILH